jgi:RNA polymerase sigma factor (sigma-70 family)
MTGTEPIVYVVDDDPSFREAIDRLLRSAGYVTHCSTSIDEFVKHTRSDTPSCMLLDVRMPGRSVFEFQIDQQKNVDSMPIIFITGHGDVPMSVRAMRNGAVNFLLKPFREEELLDAVRDGINQDRSRRAMSESIADLRSCVKSLSPRERQILARVSDGMTNREIARQLGLQEITIKVNRAKAMKKMRASSLADLVRKIQSVDLSS